MINISQFYWMRLLRHSIYNLMVFILIFTSGVITKIKLCLHLHNTYGFGLKNLCSALGFGVKEFDTSLGGIGGTPFIKNSKGNIATEDTVSMLDSMGYYTGIDLKKVSKCSRYLEKIIGEHYFSGKLYKKN